MSAMSDSGLKPTVVYHNLTPAELYEKVIMEVDEAALNMVWCNIFEQLLPASCTGASWGAEGLNGHQVSDKKWANDWQIRGKRWNFSL